MSPTRNTPGYVTETVNQIEVPSGGAGASVLVTGVTRDLDAFIQSQLRTETGGAGFANQTSNILGQLQSIYGTPGGTGTLETALNNFTSAIQALQTNSTGLSAQTTALSAAQTLAQQLNTTSQGIQTLRTNVEQDIGNSVAQANTDLKQIAAHQHQASEPEPDRSFRRDAGRSARQRHQRPVEPDGRQGRRPTAPTRSTSLPHRHSARRREARPRNSSSPRRER